MQANLPAQPTVSRVEIPKFMGRWYVIASIPTIFEKQATNAVETYTWNESYHRIDVDFRFNKGRVDGPMKRIPQTGFIHDPKSNAEWRIRPFWPLSFVYLIVELASDYSDTMIGVPSRKHVWIMAREPRMNETRYNDLVAKAQALGYDISKLKKVPHVV